MKKFEFYGKRGHSKEDKSKKSSSCSMTLEDPNAPSTSSFSSQKPWRPFQFSPEPNPLSQTEPFPPSSGSLSFYPECIDPSQPSTSSLPSTIAEKGYAGATSAEAIVSSSPGSRYHEYPRFDEPSTSGVGADHQDVGAAAESDAEQREFSELSQEQRQRKEQKCRMCLNHNKHVKMKGHKGFCTYINCHCTACHITRMNQHYSRKRQKLTRSQQRGQKDDQQRGGAIAEIPGDLKLDFPRMEELVDQTTDILDYDLFEAVNKYCGPRFNPDNQPI